MPGIQKREIPTSLENEEALLGAVLSEAQTVLPMVSDFLSADDFYSNANSIVYEACSTLYNGRNVVDLSTVTEQLKKMQKLEAVGGISYLVSLMEGVYVCANAEAYARIIADKSTQRRLIKATEDVNREAYADAKSVEELIALAEDSLMSVSKRSSGKSWSPVVDIIPDVYTDLEAAAGKKGITGIPTGFLDLDRITRGLHEADLVYVGARPGMGKTAFMLEIARYVAVQKHVPVAVFNLEMSKKQMVTRILSSQSGVSNTKLATGELSLGDWSDLSVAANELADAPLYIDDVIDSTIESIRGKCRKLQQEKNIQLVVIDYLQLVTSSRRRGSGSSRQEEVSDISRTLKMLARELGIPVIVGCQLSRALEGRDDKRPILSDLRESGTLEQDADIVLFLYREYKYNEQPELKNLAEVIIGKHRNGPNGTVKLMFDDEHVCFRNMTTRGEK